MLSNYFTIALRTLSKNRLFTLLNIGGLAGGLATGLLILLWVQDERSFDRHHKDAERIYRISAHFKSGDEIDTWATTPAPHAAYALREIPEVEKALRISGMNSSLVRYGDQSNMEKEGIFADTSFFQLLQTEVLAGDPARPFGTDLNAVVVTESFGERYFGGREKLATWVGKVLQFDDKNLVVSAVLRDFPENTNYKYDFLRPYEYLKANFEANDYWKSREEDWGDFNDLTFLKLRSGADLKSVEQKLTAIQRAHNKLDGGSYYTLQALPDLHLQDVAAKNTGAGTVRIMGFAALFILLIACINYINLATAKSTQRALEVGLRKAIGAGRGQLIGQFFTESAIVFVAASALALLLAQLLLPVCNQIADKKLTLDLANGSILLLLGSILGGALLLSAIYPALVLSAFSPIQAMKGGKSSGADGQSALRKILVVVQFACSVALLSAMLVIGRQMDFIRTKNLGYDRSHVFTVALTQETYKNRDAMVQTLQNSTGVTSVTMASDNILSLGNTTGDLKWDGKTDDHHVVIAPVAIPADFLSFFNFQLQAGEGFRGTKADSTHFILNETAVKQMGLQNPVGSKIRLRQTDGTVIGVAKDFHFRSLRDPIKPAIFLYNPAWMGAIYIKTTGAGADQAIAATEKVWKQFEQKYPFDYEFLDATFDKMYRKEARTAILFRAFSSIALLISCLGLFGLAAFTAERRVKEIGIRKVLGASVASITSLLAKDFLKLVLIAIVIASPLAWYFMNQWLSNFAYRIDIEWWVFAAAGALALLIAFLTVSFQSVKAALANPVKSLKSE